MATDTDALFQEFSVQARAAVGAFALVILLANRRQKLLLLGGAAARLAFVPIGVATARDLHYATQSGDPVLPLMLLDELVPYCGRTVKIPTDTVLSVKP